MDVILDVDPGVDDAMAILLALASRELNVLALTAVCGNVPLDTGADNALRLLGFSKRDDIPVYRGAATPLSGDPVHAFQVHGESGIGNATLPPTASVPMDGAAAFLASALVDNPGEITLIAVGPLTNLALAEEASPGCLNLARNVIVMGGAVAEPGNASPTAEYNFLADPEAARRVVSMVDHLTIVPLDVTHRIGIDSREIEESIRSSGSDRSAFFCKATEVVVQHGSETGGYHGVYLHDPAAVAYAIAPECFEVEMLRIDVETSGELTTGQLVVDRRVGVTGGKRRGCRRAVALGVQSDAVLRLFRQRVLGL